MQISKDIDISEINGKEFSIILPFYNNEAYLTESIESVINQNIGFEKNVQLILVNCGSSDHSLDIADEYEKQFPDNIFLLTADTTNIVEGYNLGLKYANGKYVNFLSGLDKFDENSFSQVHNGFKKFDEGIIALPVSVFANNNYTPTMYLKKGVMDLDDFPESYHKCSALRP